MSFSVRISHDLKKITGKGRTFSGQVKEKETIFNEKREYPMIFQSLCFGAFLFSRNNKKNLLYFCIICLMDLFVASFDSCYQMCLSTSNLKSVLC